MRCSTSCIHAVESYTVTPASVHDSQVFDELPDQTEALDDHKRAVYADSAYRSQDQEQRLADAKIDSHLGGCPKIRLSNEYSLTRTSRNQKG